MADEMYAFLDLKGIKGGALDAQFTDHIELQSVSWGVTNPGGFDNGSGGSKHAGTVHELSLSKIMCRASPTLMQYCTTGDHITEGKLSLCWQSGDDKKPYYEVNLKKIRVTSYHMASSGGANHPSESLSLQFVEMEVTHTPQSNEGSADGAVRFGYDTQKKQKT
jgi:type VI secretion system secreted protein Hcp